MKYLNSIVLSILLLSGIDQSMAEEGKPLTKEQIDQLEAGSKALEALENLKSSFDSMIRERGNDCLKAFGHEQFCKCLNSELAVGLSFQDYIVVITNTKEEIKYDQLTEDKKKLVDGAYRVRDICVGKMHDEK